MQLIKKLIRLLIFSSLVMLLTSKALMAEERLGPRLQIGLNLFPAVVAANKRLSQLSKDKPLTVYIVYSDKINLSKKLKQTLQMLPSIRGHELNIKEIQYADLIAQNITQYNAIFIGEKMGPALAEIIQYAIKQQVILFSPFKGDVEQGVISGFKVSNKVLPAINIKSMNSANIDLKAFFLRVAVKYDQ